MPNFIKLGHTFLPRRGESLLSFLVRICGANGMSPQEFCSEIVGRGPESFASLASLPEYALSIARTTGLPETDVCQMMHVATSADDVTVLGVTIPSAQLDRTNRRFAPGKLKQDPVPFQRMRWSIRLISCDPSSGEILTHRCQCGASLQWWQTSKLLECTVCRGVVTDLPPRFATAEEMETSRFWSGLFSSRPEKNRSARAALPQEFRELITADLVRIASHLDAAGAGRPAPSLKTGTALMQAWPLCLADMTPTARLIVTRAVATVLQRAS